MFYSEARQQLEYTLVRTPSIRRKQRKHIGASEGVKKDTYSEGVIIYTTVSYFNLKAQLVSLQRYDFIFT